MSSCHSKGGKRSKSVLKMRVAIIFLDSIRINAKPVLELLRIEPGTNSYKQKSITLSYIGSLPCNFQSLILKRYEFKIYSYVIHMSIANMWSVNVIEMYEDK